MFVCRRCGHENPSGANFCSSCGAPLPADDETTASIAAIEERLELEEELGTMLEDLPEGARLLVVRRGPNAGSRYLLDGSSTSVGRHPDSDIFLDDITVSRRHAVLEHPGDDVVVRDVGSLNGTYVNRERVDEGSLRHGDELQIGRFVLTFLRGGEGER